MTSYSSFVHNEIHYPEINVPFSWEYKPGISKVTNESFKKATAMRGGLVLQPPPCSSAIRNHSVREVEAQSPIVLCPIQASSLRIISLRKESLKEEDPFMEAYNNCTRTPFTVKSSKTAKRTRTGSIICKYRYIFSCKHSCDVSRIA